MGARSLSFFATLFACLLIVGCGQPSQSGSESTAAGAQNLVLEREISGSILGQRLGRPQGIAVDSRGFVYITDNANHRVIRFQYDFTPQEAVGGLGLAPGNFDQPGDIDVDRSGNAFVIDGNNRRLVRLDIHLRQSLEIKLSDASDPLKYGEPSGIAVGDNAEIWMTDRERGRVAIFDLTGQFLRFAGDADAGKGMLSGPTGIAYRGKDGFVVCDTDNGRLVYFDQYGNYLHHLDFENFSPTAIAIDSAGNAWVMDTYTGSIVYVVQIGARAHAGGPVVVGLRVPLKNPTDIAVLGHGLLAVADSGNDRLAVIRAISVQP